MTLWTTCTTPPLPRINAAHSFPVLNDWLNWLIQVCLVVLALRHTWINQFSQSCKTGNEQAALIPGSGGVVQVVHWCINEQLTHLKCLQYVAVRSGVSWQLHGVASSSSYFSAPPVTGVRCEERRPVNHLCTPDCDWSAVLEPASLRARSRVLIRTTWIEFTTWLPAS